jgi:hypothetical protein
MLFRRQETDSNSESGERKEWRKLNVQSWVLELRTALDEPTAEICCG